MIENCFNEYVNQVLYQVIIRCTSGTGTTIEYLSVSDSYICKCVMNELNNLRRTRTQIPTRDYCLSMSLTVGTISCMKKRHREIKRLLSREGGTYGRAFKLGGKWG
jgi:hypothetical protein